MAIKREPYYYAVTVPNISEIDTIKFYNIYYPYQSKLLFSQASRSFTNDIAWSRKRDSYEK